MSSAFVFVVGRSRCKDEVFEIDRAGTMTATDDQGYINAEVASEKRVRVSGRFLV